MCRHNKDIHKIRGMGILTQNRKLPGHRHAVLQPQ